MTAPMPLMLYAGVSLKEALSEMARAFEAAHVCKVEAKFGPSGLLKDAVAHGAAADVFAAANMAHPRTLRASDRSGPVACFPAIHCARWCGLASAWTAPRCSIAYLTHK